MTQTTVMRAPDRIDEQETQVEHGDGRAGFRQVKVPKGSWPAVTSDLGDDMSDEDAPDRFSEEDGYEREPVDDAPFASEDAQVCNEEECDEESLDDRPAEELSIQELGKRGEDAAVRYLKLNGYQILERNWMCKFGEADIIALDDDNVICFIEVKTRRSIEAGVPEEAVTRDKQRRYEKIALCYMMEADWEDGVSVRFDAIGICVTGNRRALLRHHKGCFDGLF